MHDCQSHPRDLCPPWRNSVSACRRGKGALELKNLSGSHCQSQCRCLRWGGCWRPWQHTTMCTKSLLLYACVCERGRRNKQGCIVLNYVDVEDLLTGVVSTTADNPFPEINCPIKMKCGPYRFNKLKTLVWILRNLDGIPSTSQALCKIRLFATYYNVCTSFIQPNSVSEPPNEMCAYLYAVIQVCSKFQLLL